MRLGSVPAQLKLINSGFNSTECWLQTRQLFVLKHAPSSLIIKMCVLEKLMNKSLGGDYDWCVRNKQATIGCCWNKCGSQTNCRWTNCRIKQTAHLFHHMCIVFLMTCGLLFKHAFLVYILWDLSLDEAVKLSVPSQRADFLLSRILGFVWTLRLVL